ASHRAAHAVGHIAEAAGSVAIAPAVDLLEREPLLARACRGAVLVQVQPREVEVRFRDRVGCHSFVPSSASIAAIVYCPTSGSESENLPHGKYIGEPPGASDSLPPK